MDGTWCAVLTVGYDGKRKRRYLCGRTKAEVLEKLKQAHAESVISLVTEPGRVRISD